MISFALALAIATKACPPAAHDPKALQTLYTTGKCEKWRPK